MPETESIDKTGASLAALEGLHVERSSRSHTSFCKVPRHTSFRCCNRTHETDPCLNGSRLMARMLPRRTPLVELLHTYISSQDHVRHPYQAASMIIFAALSPIMIVGALVLPLVIVGITDASAIRKPCAP